MTSDRIIRCNPSAYDAHKDMNGFFHTDGRLKDPILLKRKSAKSRSPLFAATLSMAVPGLGRTYSGRVMDGAFGFLMTALVVNAAAHSIKEKSVFAPLLGGAAITIYSGEVYGAYRTAKYYQAQ
jgi:TM2 domain-containing membrane protein YozV